GRVGSAVVVGALPTGDAGNQYQRRLRVGAAADRWRHACGVPRLPWRTVLGTGFLGGYTTFSTLAYETHGLARQGYTGHAWVNALGTLLAGIGAAALGIVIGRMF
ncbi:MAG: fluoride efflux transporter FluC, partial [Ktedonobacterales bacterium]